GTSNQSSSVTDSISIVEGCDDQKRACAIRHEDVLLPGCAVRIGIWVSSFSSKGMRRGFCRKASALVYIALAVAGVAGDRNLLGQTRALSAAPFEIGAGIHDTRAQWQNSVQHPTAIHVATY